MGTGGGILGTAIAKQRMLMLMAEREQQHVFMKAVANMVVIQNGQQIVGL